VRDEELVEAALFVAGRPVSEKKLKEIVGSRARVRQAVEHLIQEYQQRHTAMEIVALDGKYVMQLKSEYAERVKTVAPREFSSPALRTLAMIAYHQPITQSRLVKLRGNSIYEHLSELKEKNLITSKPHGRTFILTTGPAFPEYFNLKTNDVEEIKKKVIELAKEQEVGLDRWLHRKPVLLTTPMYESLLRHCGISEFLVSQELYSAPEAVVELQEASVVILSRGYAERIREHFAGEIIEVSAATFEDLIESMEKLKHLGKARVIDEKIAEIKEMREKFVDKTLGFTTTVTPTTEMAARIAGELHLSLSTSGKKLAPDYGTTKHGVDVTSGADILIPTHQKNLDVIARIAQRYQSIIDQIKQLEREDK
jgi:segregation and condensation protein B